jgi:four helix bundle protein
MMATIERFEEIETWDAARLLVKDIYRISQGTDFSRDWGLRDQIQRAAVSIMSNIAEGFERGSNKEFVQFLFYARVSAGEVRSLLYVAHDQKYVDNSEFCRLLEVTTIISRQIESFITYLQSSSFKKR